MVFNHAVFAYLVEIGVVVMMGRQMDEVVVNVLVLFVGGFGTRDRSGIR